MDSQSVTSSPVVFLLDVDNTLLDNDRVAADLKRYLTCEVGVERQERYWAIFEALRGDLGYADYLGALQRYRIENPHDPRLLAVSSFLINYRLRPRSAGGELSAAGRHHRAYQRLTRLPAACAARGRAEGERHAAVIGWSVVKCDDEDADTVGPLRRPNAFVQEWDQQ